MLNGGLRATRRTVGAGRQRNEFKSGRRRGSTTAIFYAAEPLEGRVLLTGIVSGQMFAGAWGPTPSTAAGLPLSSVAVDGVDLTFQGTLNPFQQTWFEPNHGLGLAPMISMGGKNTLQLRPEQVDVTLGRGQTGDGSTVTESLRFHFIGANPAAASQGLAPLGAFSNYVTGADPNAWILGVPHFGRVRFEQAYRGIDIEHYTTAGGDYEFDLVVQPGADLGAVALRIDGAQVMDGPDGNLNLTTPLGTTACLQRPVVYQVVRQQRVNVGARFLLNSDGTIGISATPVDSQSAMIVDPVLTVDYKSYLGGSSYDQLRSVDSDAAGNAYVGGETLSSNFPGSPPGAPSRWRQFIAKINADGTLGYTTFFWGSQSDYLRDVDVNEAGMVAATGATYSADFPQTGLIRSFAGIGDVFIMQLNTSGVPVLSTLWGGGGDETGQSVAWATAQTIDVAGYTTSTNFPTVLPIRAGQGDGADAFFLELNADTPAITRATTLGGSGSDYAHGLAIAPDGAVYIGGSTTSDDLPASGTDLIRGSSGTDTDGFLMKLAAHGDAILATTYVASLRAESVEDVAVDPAGFPVVVGDRGLIGEGGSYTNGGVFVTKYTPDLKNLVYETMIDGTALDTAGGIAADQDGNIVVVGTVYSGSFGFPIFDAFQTSFGGGQNDGFVAWLNPDGARLCISYLGGTSDDHLLDVASGPGRTLFLAGYTESTDIASGGGPQPTFAGVRDGLTAKLTTPVLTPAVVLRQSNTTTYVSEGRTQDAVTFRLTSKPTADVTVAFGAVSPLVSAPALNFTPANWFVPQTLRIQALPDGIAQGTRTLSVGCTVSSSDPAYNNRVAPSLSVRVGDELPGARTSALAQVTNSSSVTPWSEVDNVQLNIKVPGSTSAQQITFAVEAAHPIQDIGIDRSQADPVTLPPGPSYPFEPTNYEIYNDTVRILKVKREAEYWRPTGMTVSVGAKSETDVHYIQFQRQIPGGSSYPELVVIYSDGSVRIKPFPPSDRDDVVPGTTVLIGRHDPGERPLAEIASLTYVPDADRFDLVYRNGDTGSILMSEFTRDVMRIQVTLNNVPAFNTQPIAAYRSMWVADGNSDADWFTLGRDGVALGEASVLQAPGGVGQWTRLDRLTRSRHNRSAPGISIGNFAYQDTLAPTVASASFVHGGNPQAVVVHFSEFVGDSLAVSDLVLRNVTTGSIIDPADMAMAYDSATQTATWTFPKLGGGQLPNGNYTAMLASSAVSDPSGNALDGDSNGAPGGDFQLSFFQLRGDANRDRKVDFTDLVAVAQHYNQSGVGYANGDLDGSGVVDFADLVAVAQNYNISLPASAAPAAPAAQALVGTGAASGAAASSGATIAAGVPSRGAHAPHASPRPLLVLARTPIGAGPRATQERPALPTRRHAPPALPRARPIAGKSPVRNAAVAPVWMPPPLFGAARIRRLADVLAT